MMAGNTAHPGDPRKKIHASIATPISAVRGISAVWRLFVGQNEYRHGCGIFL